MSQVLLQLGRHRFTVSELSYSKLMRSFSARWKEHFTAGGGFISQKLGKNPRELNIDGVVFPYENNDYDQVLALGEDIEAGTPMRFMSFHGDYFGMVKALAIDVSDESTIAGVAVTKARYTLKISQLGDATNPNAFMSNINFNSIINEIRALF